MPKKYWVVVEDYSYEEGETTERVVKKTDVESVARASQEAWIKFYQKLGYRIYAGEDDAILANSSHEIKVHLLQMVSSRPQ